MITLYLSDEAEACYMGKSRLTFELFWRSVDIGLGCYLADGYVQAIRKVMSLDLFSM
jgi:hypothetical protein